MSVPKYLSAPAVLEAFDSTGSTLFRISGVIISRVVSYGIQLLFSAKPCEEDINPYMFIDYRTQLPHCYSDVVKSTLKGERFAYASPFCPVEVTMTLLDGGDRDKIIAALVKEEMCKQ